jgi:predicted phage terminase large subunit-like protein
MFEAGNVFVPEGAPWLDQWLKHFEEFPAGSHDDAVDATALVWHAQKASSGVWLPG